MSPIASGVGVTVCCTEWQCRMVREGTGERFVAIGCVADSLFVEGAVEDLEVGVFVDGELAPVSEKESKRLNEAEKDRLLGTLGRVALEAGFGLRFGNVQFV